MNGISGTYKDPEGYFVCEKDPEGFERFEATFPKKEKAEAAGTAVLNREHTNDARSRQCKKAAHK